ncbi:MAG: ABC transporter permease [Parcubacteria group bacterium]|nr:ABC transporter permease [Parcubacteria group bacterium]
MKFSHLVLIAVRNLFGEKGRLAITAGGVAFSVVLILVLVGLYQAWSAQITKFLGSLPADIWVGQKGSGDMSHSVSLLPANLKEVFKDKNYIRAVTPFVGRQTSFELNGEETHLFMVGVDAEGMIRPYKVVEGKPLPSKGEIIVDKVYARAKGVSIGDTLDIGGKKLTIVGVSSGGNLLVYSYAFAEASDVRDILKFQTFTNFYLIQTGNPDEAVSRLRSEFPDLAVMRRADFLQTNANLIRETFLPIIFVLVVIAVSIGIAVIGLTIFTATIEKSREYGVLKAIGYDTRQLFSIVFIQSFIAGILGFALGNILAALVTPIAERFVGGFIYEIGFVEVLGVGILTLLISIIASFIPLRRITTIDPAQVFKA